MFTEPLFKRYKQMNSRAQNQAGFTMVELMIAMVLGLLVSGAAVVIVVSALGQMRNSQDFAEVIDNGRVVLEMMGDDIVHAGFMGELSGQPLINGSNIIVEAGAPTSDCNGDGLNNGTFPNAAAVATFRLLWGETLDGSQPMDCIGSSVRAGSDLIQIKRLIGRTNTAASAATANPNRIFLVTNASSGILYSSNGTPASALPTNPTYYEYQHRVYYISEVSRYGESDFPVLVRESLLVSGSSVQLQQEEIAEGIEDMRFLYGVDVDGDLGADRFVEADDVTDDEWDNAGDSRVVSVRIGLLMRAIEADAAFIDDGEMSYTYAGETAAFSDGIRRKVLETTVSLKNYQIGL